MLAITWLVYLSSWNLFVSLALLLCGNIYFLLIYSLFGSNVLFFPPWLWKNVQPLQLIPVLRYLCPCSSLRNGTVISSGMSLDSVGEYLYLSYIYNWRWFNSIREIGEINKRNPLWKVEFYMVRLASKWDSGAEVDGKGSVNTLAEVGGKSELTASHTSLLTPTPYLSFIQNKTFKQRKNRALLTLRCSQKQYEIFSNNVLQKKHYPETVKFGNNPDCMIQSCLSAWVVRDFISHSLHSVVAWFAIWDFCLPCSFFFIYLFIYFLFIYLSRGIQFSRASLNGALTKHKNKDIETLKLNNQVNMTFNADVTV